MVALSTALCYSPSFLSESRRVFMADKVRSISEIFCFSRVASSGRYSPSTPRNGWQKLPRERPNSPLFLRPAPFPAPAAPEHHPLRPPNRASRPCDSVLSPSDIRLLLSAVHVRDGTFVTPTATWSCRVLLYRRCFTRNSRPILLYRRMEGGGGHIRTVHFFFRQAIQSFGNSLVIEGQHFI